MNAGCPTCGRPIRTPPGHPVEHLGYACTACGTAMHWTPEEGFVLLPSVMAEALAHDVAALREFLAILAHVSKKGRLSP